MGHPQSDPGDRPPHGSLLHDNGAFLVDGCCDQCSSHYSRPTDGKCSLENAPRFAVYTAPKSVSNGRQFYSDDEMWTWADLKMCLSSYIGLI